MTPTALVIQGPLRSRGRTFSSVSIPQSNHIDYDCTDNINRLIRDYRELFEIVIVCLWEEDYAVAKGNITDDENVVVISVMDRTRNFYSNKFRQFSSTHAGLKVANDLGIGHSIKIRSDQNLDLEALTAFLSRCSKSGLDRVIVPYMIESDPFNLNDFYIAGPTNVLISLCELFVGKKAVSFYNDVHYDLFFKLAWVTRSKTWPRASLRSYISDYCPPHDAQQVLIAEQAWTTALLPAPESVWMSLEWRGAANSDTSPPFLQRYNALFASDQESDISAGVEIFHNWRWSRPLRDVTAMPFMKICWQRYLVASDSRIAFLGKWFDLPNTLWMVAHRRLKIPKDPRGWLT
jgi:hypothetical protein